MELTAGIATLRLAETFVIAREASDEVEVVLECSCSLSIN